MTQDQFIDDYCRRSRLNREWLMQHRRVEPCGKANGCRYALCNGWRMVPID